MRKNRNKNYTFYWMIGISVVLTIPISFIIIRRVQAGDIMKTVLIMLVFFVLLFAIMLLYKNIFGVTVKEITQEEKVTELERLNNILSDFRRKYSNPLMRKSLDAVEEQSQRFKRRKNVMLEVVGAKFNSEDSTVLGDLVETVEEAIVINLEKIVNRVEIFDDEGLPEIIRQNIGYIEEQIHKNNVILSEFETLITETSRMGEIHEEKDISRLRDVVNAMQSLRKNSDEELEELTKKYNEGTK